jgi:opacity protein-like surface antigen
MSLRHALLPLALLAAASSPAIAQDAPADWSGFYIGASVGGNNPSDARDRGVEFDTNLDGQFGDTVRTTTGANAFSPGFCGGSALTPRAADGCREDQGGDEWGVRAGFDWQMGRFVLGGVLEHTQNDARDSQVAFSTTPAHYTFTRDLDSMTALRARAGYAFGRNGDWLPYVTAGAVRADVEHSFVSSNTANTFTPNGSGSINGVQGGLGLERRVSDNFSVGLEALFTRLQDDEYTVAVTRGTAPATNPFVLTNPAGTTMRRVDEDFDVASVKVTANWRF